MKEWISLIDNRIQYQHMNHKQNIRTNVAEFLKIKLLKVMNRMMKPL